MKGVFVMKKALCTILTLCMLVSLLPLHSSANVPTNQLRYGGAYRGACGENMTWSYDEFMFVLDIYGSGQMEPASDWKGMYIEQLEIHSGAESVCDYAFENHREILFATLPASIKTIGMNAFKNCGMQEMLIPGEYVGVGAFQKCSDLTYINMTPKNSIDRDAFRDCADLDNIIIRADKVGDHAFAGATKSRTVYVLTPDCEFGQDVFTPAVEGVEYTVYGFPGSTAEETFGDSFKPLCSCETESEDNTVSYPSCTESGYVTYSCRVCGESLQMVRDEWRADHYYERRIYSPDTYGNGKTGTLGDLCRALFAYSDSAKAWFMR